jgi:RHS repeat-associated protein
VPQFSRLYYLFQWDPQGLLVQRQTGGSGGSNATFTALNGMTADGWRARYVNNESQAYDFVYNPQGTLVQRQTAGGYNASVAAVDETFYEGYGALRQDYDVLHGGGVPTHHDPVGFGGQFGYYTDTETGLLCLTHRYYDPGTGKFINRDPIGYAGGENLYGFTDGNPVNRQDPNGTSSVTIQHDNRTLLQKAADAVHNWFIGQCVGFQMRQKASQKHQGPPVCMAPVPDDLFGAFGVDASEVDASLMDEALEESSAGEGASGGRAWSRHGAERARQRDDKMALLDAQQASQSDVLIQENSEGNAAKYIVRGPNSREHVVSMTERRVITTLGHEARTNAAKQGRIEDGIIRHTTEEEYEAFQQLYRR